MFEFLEYRVHYSLWAYVAFLYVLFTNLPCMILQYTTIIKVSNNVGLSGIFKEDLTHVCTYVHYPTQT